MVKQNKDILTMLDEMTDEEFLERLESLGEWDLDKVFLTNIGMCTIGLYEELPLPTSTEDVVRKGYGSYYEVYSPTLVNNELVWKKMAWSY